MIDQADQVSKKNGAVAAGDPDDGGEHQEKNARAAQRSGKPGPDPGAET